MWVHFKGIQFTQANWIQIRHLKKECQEEALECEALKHFNMQEEFLKKSQENIEELEKETPKIIFELLNAPPNSAERKELEVKKWTDHSKMFSVLLSLDKDYLATSASSCADEKNLKPQTIERCVSSHIWLKQGIQVTVVRRLKIIPQLGKTLASPRGGYKVITETARFEKAQKIIKNYVYFSQKTSKK
ncbi:hypothetical protein VP01_3520g5 [Puccinia sorghi]|uniref:Uncharacterized protein n=1 Tax=Puccinia sorghi TaxID=27349 RepID=A0A0L6UWD7_9BASI|nr:hypothetical protein VP01_3520g5 [Puccinia sorghi]